MNELQRHRRHERKAARRRARMAKGKRRRPRAVERGLRASIAAERLERLTTHRPKPTPPEARKAEQRRPRMRNLFRFGRHR